ncbi:CvfB family protein [Clostridium felsineum]|uniref:Conserved virulence factor B n=1 Tax=Clostridium felsineum TaxID=36839 RepID=A0A1S8M9T8_9CLOT|nr:S1-like domain-containing RNA-binding protein [Clostridium felsineum]MCR3760260.1 DNA-binding protein [Clostridium felsineum]URZ00505.1 Conserved virulence factor B [Clostridium felsineum]URZ06857.1 Conserved virulence factor B [Clostridium felsineum]URZ11889.1 Conserved virulence factor B [Clostridium felsineum]URZ16414.1 Conserved virulence factor B [Clostridium felsineum DSM 794]
MVKIGEYNELKVARKSDFGFFLDAETGSTSDDILLPIKDIKEEDSIEIGSLLNVFIYRDSKDRPIATTRTPYAKVSDIAYLKVVSNTKIGAFLDFGLERDLFVPIKEQSYLLEPNKKYLFYVYLDKTGRLAATTYIDKFLETLEDDEVLKNELSGTVYGFQSNGTIMLAINNKYKGVILKNECFIKVTHGDVLSNLRFKRKYEDGQIGLTTRKYPKNERMELETTIYEYLKKNNGFMPYNDKSSPEDIKRVFHESKNYFKNALGGLMKKGLITQDKSGTKLVK